MLTVFLLYWLKIYTECLPDIVCVLADAVWRTSILLQATKKAAASLVRVAATSHRQGKIT